MPYQETLQQQIAKTLTPAHLCDPAIRELLNLVDASYKNLSPAGLAFAEKNIDLRQLLCNIKVFNGSNAESRGNRIRLVIDEALPKYVTGNEVRLYQALNNLVTNAIACTKNGVITVGMQLYSIGASDITVHFSLSYGPAENGLEKDSTFQFTFAFKPGIDPFHSQLNSVKDLSNTHVLLVEDVEYNVVITEKMLTGWKARVDVANNGVEALTKARQTQYNIVLMDLQMPVMDGYSATRHIRYFDKQIPIVALTASAMPEIMNENEWGLTDFLAKPFQPAALYDMVYKYTKRSA